MPGIVILFQAMKAKSIFSQHFTDQHLLRKGAKMKNKWRNLMAAFCAASMLMALPGVSVYAAEIFSKNL